MDMETKDDAPQSSIRPQPTRRKPRGFKIALGVLAALFILFALVIYFLPHFLPIGTIKGIAKTKAREMAGVDVDFTNLRFGWNGDLVIDNIVVAPYAPDGALMEPLLTVEEARTNVALMPLLSGKAIVNSVDMENLVLSVRRLPDGSLNIPDFSQLEGTAEATGPTANRRVRLAATAPVETVPAVPAEGIPPIEIRQVNIRNGLVSYVDEPGNLNLDLGLDFVRVDGQTLEDPFILSGRLLPYPGQPGLGELPFTGRVALLRGGEFNPEGEANLEIDVKNFSLHELAAKFGMGDFLAAAQMDGMIKAGYAAGKAAVNIPELRVSRTALNLGLDTPLNVPDTSASLNAVFDPAPGRVQLDELSITNNLTAIRATGRVDGINEMADGVTPAALIDFTGAADFAGASAYLAAHNLLPDGLPELEGKSSFVGKAQLPSQRGGALAPTVTVDFSDGGVQIREPASGLVAAIELKGVGVRAAATMADETTLTAAVNLAGVPARAIIPTLGSQPVAVTLNGGAALDHSSQASRVELRLDETQAAIPATPWSAAAAVTGVQARILADLNRDIVTVQNLKATVNNALQGGVTSGQISGLMAGQPQGQVDLELAGVLEQIRQFLAPVFPDDLLPTITGTLRGATRLKVAGADIEALVRGEVDDSHIVLNVVKGESQAELQTPKATLALLASTNMQTPGRIIVQSLEVAGNNTNVQYSDVSASALRGQTGNSLIKAAGTVDTDAGVGHLTNLTIDVNGMNLALGQGGQQLGSLTSGLMKVVAAAPEHPIQLPLAGTGEFNLPDISLGIDNLLFKFQEDQSNFGNFRARFGVDGYIGNEQRQLINLRTASLSAAPLALNSRGQVDLGSGALLAEYAARVAPTGMSSLLGYLGLPPTLLTDAAVSGTLSYNGSVVSSKGAAQGQLSSGGDGANPFEVAHDLSAAWNPADSSLALDIRRLDGNVKTRSGEAVATMMAQQSKLLLSRAGSKGLLDIRFNGSAGPTRQFLLGLVGLFPQLGDVANTLHSADVGGAYNAWLQVRDKDAVTLGINAGGVWEGAALTLAGAPYIAEAAKLSAALEGDFAYQDNQVRLSRMLLRSDSGMMQADGVVTLNLTAGDDNLPNGLARLDADLKFVMADIRKAAMVLPGIVPADMGLTGRIDGQLKAGGNANDIRIDTGVVRFQNFAATPLGVTIPSGQATFGGVINLHMAGGGSGTPWDAARLLDITGGQVAVTGVQVQGKAVDEMAASFQLQGGVVTLQSARVAIGGGAGGTVQANGTVDLNSAAPAVNVQVALQNIPLSEVNSEITDYMQIQSGVLNLPAQQGQAAGVQFQGFDKDEILRTIRLDNFTFATSPVALDTGPVLNAELDKARAILKQNTTDNRSRRVTFSRISGTVRAAGDGVIHIPQDQPIDLIGEDTADFRAFGRVMANHTMDMRVMIMGKLENLIGFTVPALLPGLGSSLGNIQTALMDTMNDSAAKGRYAVHVKGSLESPDISGIGQLAGVFLTDMLKSQVLTGLLGETAGNLGSVVGGLITDPKEVLQNIPQNLVKTPGNVLEGLEEAFGRGEDGQGGRPKDVLRGLGKVLAAPIPKHEPKEEESRDQEERQRSTRPQDVLRGILGGGQQEDGERRRPRLPFGIR